jgi:hypothetical protein
LAIIYRKRKQLKEEIRVIKRKMLMLQREITRRKPYGISNIEKELEKAKKRLPKAEALYEKCFL